MTAFLLMFFVGMVNSETPAGSDLIEKIYVKTVAMPDRPGMLKVTLTCYFKPLKKRRKIALERPFPGDDQCLLICSCTLDERGRTLQVELIKGFHG